MAESSSNIKKKKGLKHWALFTLRWGIAVVGVVWVVSKMTIHDQALVVLDSRTNRPQMVSLREGADEKADVFKVVDPANTSKTIDVGRDDVWNAPDTKKINRITIDGVKTVSLLGVDLSGDLNSHPQPVRFLVADDPVKGNAQIIPAADVEGYTVHVPYPRDQVGLQSMVSQARGWLLWAALLVFPITFVITSYRWHELLEAVDVPMGMGRAFVINMVGSFYNSFLPGSTGGDAFKAYYASKQTPHRTRAVMSVLVDRAVGLLALIMLGGATACFQWHIKECREVAIGSAAICLCVLVGSVVFYNPTLHRISGLDFLLKKLPMQKQVRGAVDTMQRYGKRPMLGIWSLVISFPVHGTVITSAMFAGIAFGLPLHWEYYWVAVPVIVLAGAIPLSPQGAGVMEFFAVLAPPRAGGHRQPGLRPHHVDARRPDPLEPLRRSLRPPRRFPCPRPPPSKKNSKVSPPTTTPPLAAPWSPPDPKPTAPPWVFYNSN